MSEKAIRIIDMPENCKACYYKQDCQEFDIGDHRPDRCHLKPLPRLENNEQVYQMMTKHSAMCNVGTSTKFSMLRFIDGWESCLDEIEGKK